MAFFDNLTTSLKQKWLTFFQDNRSWISLQMQVEAVYTPDGGRRPSSYLILGVVNALEPQLVELMLPFSKLNPDADALIEVLELNFDPDLLLGNRFNPQAVSEELSNLTVIEALTQVNLDELSDMALDELADEVVLVEYEQEPIVVLNPTQPDEFGDMSLDEIASVMGLEQSDDESLETPNLTQPDEFGDMSLDEIASVMGLEQSDDESLGTPNPTQPDEFGDVLSDVWSEGTSSESEKADEKQSEIDQEISRLFPNS